MKQNKASVTYRNVVNLLSLFIIYQSYAWSRDSNTKFTLGICLIRTISQFRMLILINIDIVGMVLNLIHAQNFPCQILNGAKTLGFYLVLTIVYHSILIITKFLGKDQRAD